LRGKERELYRMLEKDASVKKAYPRRGGKLGESSVWGKERKMGVGGGGPPTRDEEWKEKEEEGHLRTHKRGTLQDAIFDLPGRQRRKGGLPLDRNFRRKERRLRPPGPEEKKKGVHCRFQGKPENPKRRTLQVYPFEGERQQAFKKEKKGKKF